MLPLASAEGARAGERGGVRLSFAFALSLIVASDGVDVHLW